MYIKRRWKLLKQNTFNTSILDEIITGYLPHTIYAFETNTFPNFLKVGDTQRKVSARLEEWRKIYSDLEYVYDQEATIFDKSNDKIVFFRDFAVHNYLINEKKYERLSTDQYENEFFKNAKKNDIEEGIASIKNDYFSDAVNKYNYYEVNEENTLVEFHFKRTQNYLPRPNQQEVINNIVEAVNNGRENLLLYAVMRFGKSNVSIWAAKEINSKLTVIVTGKADVKNEWKKAVESHVDFENFIFTDVNNFDSNFYENNKDKNIVVFTTLQDLAGSRSTIKNKHSLIFDKTIDFLIIDESHFGARADVYKQTITKKYEDLDFNDDLKDQELYIALKEINSLDYSIKLHLSGTPYRILLSNEFEEEDIVGKIQFTDILAEKRKWIEGDLVREEERPWENPYFGFPEMVRFAFTPNESSIKKLENIKKEGTSWDLNELLKPESTSSKNSEYVSFTHEPEVLDLLRAIDGSQEDSNIFPFLDYQKIKEGNLTNHIVLVLPFKNSCDAMKRLIESNKDEFINLNSYKILNVAGNTSNYTTVGEVQQIIKESAIKGQKTITLTVNRMLTGTTVPEWDTMIFLKDTKSPQEYDQAIFRLQSPWVKDVVDIESGVVCGKEDLKPQTLLIDFSPNRLFKIESERAIVVNAADKRSGNYEQERQIQKNISLSPIIYLNKEELVEIKPTDIIKNIREFSSNKSIVDEVNELPIDESLYNIPELHRAIAEQPPLNGKKGFETKPYEGSGNDLEIPDGQGDDNEEDNDKGKSSSPNDRENNDDFPTAQQMLMYYSRILFYTYLSENTNKNLRNIIDNIDNDSNLASHLNLDKEILKLMADNINPFIIAKLDDKIENIYELRQESKGEKILNGIKKFGRLSPNEIFTPNWVANKMVDELINEEFIKEYREEPKKILDLGSKSAVFLVRVYNKLKQAGIDERILKSNLYAIATSEISYEFNLVVFKEFGWDLNNLSIPEKFVSNQVITSDDIENDLKDVFGDDNLKFDVIIGNPPYQEQKENTSDNQFYHKFMEQAYILAEKVMFITPGKFLFNAGKTPKTWNEKMLNDQHLKLVHYEADSKKIFPDSDISGSIVITYRDTTRTWEPIGKFYPNKEHQGIVEKVTNSKNFTPLYNEIYLQAKFDLNQIYNVYPDLQDILKNERRLITSVFKKDIPIFTDNPTNEDDVKIWGNNNKGKLIYKFIKKEFLDISSSNINGHKVFLGSTNGGAGNLSDKEVNIIGTPKVIYKNESFTQTFISIGNFDKVQEAENLCKYLKTKFARFMIGTLKATSRINKDIWNNIPTQDFSINSHIDWSLSVNEIDEVLFSLYNFNNDEIIYINSKIRPMD